MTPVEIAAAATTVSAAAIYVKAGVDMVRLADPATAAHLSVPEHAWRLAGAAQVAGALGLLAGVWLPWLGLVGGVCLVLLMLGALGSHLRAGDPVTAWVPAVVVVAVTVAAVVLQQR